MYVLSSRIQTLSSRRHWRLVALAPGAHCLFPLYKQVYRGWAQVAVNDNPNADGRAQRVAAGGG